MGSDTTITLLGGIEISRAGTSTGPLPVRALHLLAYLVTHPDVPQPRAHLAGLLWPGSDDAQARTNLRRELHHLRGLVPDCLEVDARSLTWHDRPSVSVDVRAFQAARDEALRALADHHPRAASYSRNAVRLYQEPFLPGCYDDWALRVREELHQACVELCDRGAEQAEPAAAIRLLRRRIGLEPYDEPGYRRLMRLQRTAGDRAGALATYHACAAALEQELGVEPSPETRRERDALLADTEEPMTDPVAPGRPGLVGRARERALLREEWTAARSGCRFVLVRGETGAGKTRLLADLAATVRAEGGVVATARCFATSGSLPMAPVAEWLRNPHLRQAARDLPAVWREEVHRLVPDGSSTDSPAERAKVDAWQRLRFFEGLARAVLAVDRPLLLSLDDLQWCDKATLAWLAFLRSFARDAPLLMVATARDDELAGSGLAEPLQTMRAARQLADVDVGALSAEETALLAAGVVGRPLREEEQALVWSASAGNPFYVVEALREALVEAGPIQAANLRGVLASRLARVSGPARRLAALASALGRDFALDLLGEAADLDDDTVVGLIDELWRRGIVEHRGSRYDFAHDLLREATYDAVTPAQRWLLHRRLAQALEKRGSEPAEVAEQYDRSGQPDQALPFYDQAARAASAVFAHQEAYRLWRRCLDLLEAMPETRQRQERELAVLQQMMPPVNAWRGYASTTLEACERRAAELGERLGLPEVQASACIAMFSTTFVQGHTAESHRWAERALTLAERSPELTGQAHMTYAGACASLGLLTDADRHFALACELCGDSDSLPIGTRTRVHARGWWAHAKWLLGEDPLPQCEEALEVARAIDHPYSLAVALSYAAITHQLCGDRSALQPVLGELTGLCERFGFAYYRQWAVVLRGWLRGDAEGLSTARRGIADLEAEGSFARMPYWLWMVADLQRQDGDLAGAAATLDAAQAVAVSNDDVWWLPEVLRAQAALQPAARAATTLARAAQVAAGQSSARLLARCRDDLATLSVRPAGS
jgi:DNA-binding SARP family transcriptional activator/tetratricopeptide (TPR) repeat protein